MDVWGAGCILFELTTLYPLFPGTDEPDQVHRIHRVLGAPNAAVVAKLRKHASPQANFVFPKQEGIGLAKLLPDATESCRDLLRQAVSYDASDRITSSRALSHAYFVGDRPLPKFKATTPTRRNRRMAKVTPQTIPSSSSFPSNPSKMAESDKASGPVKADPEEPLITKPRSMVSILLARVSDLIFV